VLNVYKRKRNRDGKPTITHRICSYGESEDQKDKEN